MIAIHSTRSTRSSLKQRVVTTLALLLCVGGAIAWRVWPQHDPRLAGTWLVSHDRWPPADEIERLLNGDESSRFTKWTLQDHGAGTVEDTFLSRGKAFRWHTEGDRLFVQYGSRSLTLREEFAELWRRLGGERSKRWHEYRYDLENTWRVRLEFGDPEHRQPHWEIRLTRIDGD